MGFGTKGCMYCGGECNKECLIKQETIENDDNWSLDKFKEFFDIISKLKFNEVNESLKDISNRVYKESLKNGKQLTYEDGFKLAVTAMFFKMYSEEDMKQAFFDGIRVTGEGYNGEYVSGNSPDIEVEFYESYTEWFNKFKKK